MEPSLLPAQVTLETGWSFASDVWGAGCIMAELYTGDLLFPTVRW